MTPDNNQHNPKIEKTSFGSLTQDSGFELPDAEAERKNDPYVSEGLTQRVVLEDMGSSHRKMDDENAMELLASKEIQDRLNAKVLTGSVKTKQPLWMKSIWLLLASMALLYFSVGKNDTPNVQMVLFCLTSVLLVCVLLTSIYGLIIVKTRNARIIYGIEGLIALLIEIGTVMLIMGRL